MISQAILKFDLDLAAWAIKNDNNNRSGLESQIILKVFVKVRAWLM